MPYRSALPKTATGNSPSKGLKSEGQESPAAAWFLGLRPILFTFSKVKNQFLTIAAKGQGRTIP